jgi:outer membrane biosynthesis protein TonB
VRRELCLALVAGLLCITGTPARAERPAAADAAVPEADRTTVDADDLRSFMASRAGLLKACYERALRREPSLRGRLSLRFTILSDGAVDDVAVTRNELGAGVARCVTSTVRGWRVPFRPAWPVTVEYPVVFTPSA